MLILLILSFVMLSILISMFMFNHEKRIEKFKLKNIKIEIEK
jgi:hypothetical protein